MRIRLIGTTALTAVLMVLGLVTGAVAPGALASETADAYADAEAQLIDLTNAARSEHGLDPLVLNVDLREVARGWTEVMAAEDHLHHNPHYTDQYPGAWERMGENVGYTYWPGGTVEQMVANTQRAFMDSSAHRANILGDYNQIGVGITVTPQDKLWVTVNFLLGPTPEQEPVAEHVEQPPPPAPPAVAEAIRVAQRLVADRAADHVVVGRAETFADALGGSGLAASDAPVLLTPGPTGSHPNRGLDPAVRAEIDRLLGGSGTLYLLGGPGAISQAVEDELALAGYQVVRLAGSSRVETALAVAEAIVDEHGAPDEILLARADDWADAVAGGGYAASANVPVLLTGRDGLHPAVADFLERFPRADVYALGGAGALSDAVVRASGATRIAGADRTATAVEIARVLWDREEARAGDHYVLVPAYAEDGWAYALSYASWSAAHAGPQLLVGDVVSEAVAEFLGDLGYSASVVGSATPSSPVPVQVVEVVEDLLGR